MRRSIELTLDGEDLSTIFSPGAGSVEGGTSFAERTMGTV